ncbi:peptide deformylase [Sedimentitalea arenosa]|jgi:peptide deformylase|uniref:Peptide deformylase n=1 Tax=Sedimentitalea arenosa TaxID=2798803 RepID=A0A8J7LWW0_9RHOB|nr:peptide deformylase [Arenibacterium arenosum]MBJ6372660.1 peptide deformylase [Arenibacterium arenosum]
MAVLPILRWPDARLNTVCSPVARQENLSRLIADMFDTMYDAYGRGLAAPQVGVMKRLFVIDVTWKDGRHSPKVFINPSVLDRSDTLVEGTEACLSIPGISTTIARPDWVAVSWTDARGRAYVRRFEGAAARCVQHEMDHLDGIVTLDRLDTVARTRADRAYAAVP